MPGEVRFFSQGVGWVGYSRSGRIGVCGWSDLIKACYMWDRFFSLQGGGGHSLFWTIQEGFAQKQYLLQAGSMQKGRCFMS